MNCTAQWKCLYAFLTILTLWDVRAYSHQAKVGTKVTKIKEKSKKDQRKFLLLLGVNGLYH